jgi:hypothetical protein
MTSKNKSFETLRKCGGLMSPRSCGTYRPFNRQNMSFRSNVPLNSKDNKEKSPIMLPLSLTVSQSSSPIISVDEENDNTPRGRKRKLMADFVVALDGHAKKQDDVTKKIREKKEQIQQMKKQILVLEEDVTFLEQNQQDEDQRWNQLSQLIGDF